MSAQGRNGSRSSRFSLGGLRNFGRSATVTEFGESTAVSSTFNIPYNPERPVVRNINGNDNASGAVDEYSEIASQEASNGGNIARRSLGMRFLAATGKAAARLKNLTHKKPANGAAQALPTSASDHGISASAQQQSQRTSTNKRRYPPPVSSNNGRRGLRRVQSSPSNLQTPPATPLPQLPAARQPDLFEQRFPGHPHGLRGHPDVMTFAERPPTPPAVSTSQASPPVPAAVPAMPATPTRPPPPVPVPTIEVTPSPAAAPAAAAANDEEEEVDFESIRAAYIYSVSTGELNIHGRRTPSPAVDESSRLEEESDGGEVGLLTPTRAPIVRRRGW